MEGLFFMPFKVRLKPGDSEFRRGRVKCQETLPNVNGIKYRFLKSYQVFLFVTKAGFIDPVINVVHVPF